MQGTCEVEALPGYEPEIGRWLWALEEVRRRTLRLVEGMNQQTLDWQGPDGRENSVGSLLYHIALVEMSWLFMDIQLREIPPAVQADFPCAMATSQGRVTPVLQVDLAEHLARLAGSRSVLLHELQGMTIDDWHRPRGAADTDFQVTPAWAVFHLVEHEAGHAAQIGALKARAARAGIGH